MSQPERQEFQITTVPDPIWREVLENLGFTYLKDIRRWVRTCAGREAAAVEAVLNQRSVPFEKKAAAPAGKMARWPKLSAELAVPDGGEPNRCGICGKYVERAHKYVECDDADNHEYPDAVRFFACPDCIREKIDPHPRLYVRLD